MKTLFITFLFVFSFQVFGQQQCSVSEINKALTKTCAIAKQGMTEQLIKDIEALTFCKGNYAWIQLRNNVGNFTVKAHRVKPGIKNNDKLFKMVVGGVALFKMLSDGGEVLKKDGEQKFISYKWKRANMEQATKKLTILRRCTENYVAGAGIWADDCTDCPDIKYGNKYLISGGE